MNPMSFFSTHTGANGAGCGAIAAGLIDIGGIELDPYPVQLYRQNFGNHVRHESILDTPIEQLPDFDFLWSSLPCPSFSLAKTNGVETPEDIAQAQKVVEMVRKKRPRYFALENVRGYLNSESFAAIIKAVDDEGYNFHYDVYDTADYGVPQNRHRLILRASRDPLGNLPQTHSKTDGLWWQPWNGWYDAVADLLPTCKRSHLTERQIQALKNKGWNLSSVLVEGKDSPSRDRTLRGTDEPCMTITANQGGGGRLPKALLVDGKGNQSCSTYTAIEGGSPSFAVMANMDRNISRAVMIERTGYGHDRLPMIRQINEPSQTIRASVGCDEKGGYRSPITALLESADVRALDYRCLARLQSFPDWYKWGDIAGRNCRAIGNAVPALFAQRVIESITGGKK
jgi:DNA (cytosine-5)-methyltransferase 1